MYMNKFKLDKEPKVYSGFNIPENYFETLSEKIQIQIKLQEKKTALKTTARQLKIKKEKRERTRAYNIYTSQKMANTPSTQ